MDRVFANHPHSGSKMQILNALAERFVFMNRDAIPNGSRDMGTD